MDYMPKDDTSTTLIFYKTDSATATLLALLIKGRKQGLTFNIFCSTKDECENFSISLWNSSYLLTHARVEDGFLKMQPIIILTQDAFNQSDIKKECAIFVECDFVGEPDLEIFQWKKVCFINVDDSIINKYKKHEFQTWHYEKGLWRQL